MSLQKHWKTFDSNTNWVGYSFWMQYVCQAFFIPNLIHLSYFTVHILKSAAYQHIKLGQYTGEE